MIIYYGYSISGTDPLIDKVRLGADLYYKKFHQHPNICHVHFSKLDHEFYIDGIKVTPSSWQLADDFLYAYQAEQPALIG